MSALNNETFKKPTEVWDSNLIKLSTFFAGHSGYQGGTSYLLLNHYQETKAANLSSAQRIAIRVP